METISVIIPAFNAGKWIAPCLESVLNQKGDFILDVIVVDDGSTDNTRHTLSRYSGKIRIISHPHSGQSVARNLALDIATGRWIMFVDADDMLLPGAIEMLLNSAELTGAQIICASYSRSCKNHITTKPAVALLESRDALATIFYRTDKALNSSMWGKLFDRKLFDEIRFWEGHIYEDLDIIPRLFLRADTVAVSNSPIYFYRRNPDSTLSRWDDRRKDMLEVMQRIMLIPDIIEDPALHSAALDRCFSAACNCMIHMQRNHDNDPAARDKCLAILRATRRATLLNPRARLRNRLAALLLPF